MEEIKAIETFYKGYRFRSRLEARWAVFFDAMGIEWRYETEGFTNGKECYLPDFFIMNRWYVEVKSLERPGALDEINKAIKFVDGKNISVLLVLSDIPQKEELENWFYPVVFYDPMCDGREIQHCHICLLSEGAYFTGYAMRDRIGKRCCEGGIDKIEDLKPIPEYKMVGESLRQREQEFLNTCRLFGIMGDLDHALFDTEVFMYDSDERNVLHKLYDKARQARFEHGECG